MDLGSAAPDKVPTPGPDRRAYRITSRSGPVITDVRGQEAQPAQRLGPDRHAADPESVGPISGILWQASAPNRAIDEQHLELSRPLKSLDHIGDSDSVPDVRIRYSIGDQQDPGRTCAGRLSCPVVGQTHIAIGAARRFVTHSVRIGLYIDSDIVGGAERSALNLLASSRQPERFVVCATSEVMLAEVAAVVPLVDRVKAPACSGFSVSVAAHRRLFRDLNLDLLQITLANPFAARAVILAAYSLRVPTVSVEQLVLPSRRRRGQVLKRIFDAPLAAHVVVGDQSGRDLHHLYGIPERSIRTIHNGVPVKRVDAVVLDHRPVIGCAARFEDQKQLDVLVEALAELPGTRLVLVGDGTRRADLEALAVRLDVAERVTFVGWVADARPWISSFDVFVLPSREEAFPLTIVEAMFAGVPVVATDVGSVSEAVLDGETGLLVPSGDRPALVEAVRRLLDEPYLADRLARQAERRARRRFSAHEMAGAYDALWSEVLARPPWWCRSRQRRRWWRRSG